MNLMMSQWLLFHTSAFFGSNIMIITMIMDYWRPERKSSSLHSAQPKINSHSQIFRYDRSIFCLPHWLVQIFRFLWFMLSLGVRCPWLWSSSVWPWSSPLAQVGISVCVSGVWAGKATRIFWRSKTLVIWKFKSCNLIALKFKTLDKSKENKNIFEFFKETKSICLFQLLEVESSF